MMVQVSPPAHKRAVYEREHKQVRRVIDVERPLHGPAAFAVVESYGYAGEAGAERLVDAVRNAAGTKRKQIAAQVKCDSPKRNNHALYAAPAPRQVERHNEKYAHRTVVGIEILRRECQNQCGN